MFVRLFVFLNVLAIAVCQEDNLLSPIIRTKSGPIQGKVLKLSNTVQVYEFTAIPFAEPPTGQRRFQKPEPKTPWTEVLNAGLNWPSACPQYDPDIDGLENSTFAQETATLAPSFSEDCLYLNLWVPNTANTSNSTLAVLTFIHGGAFSSGATSMKTYNGTVLAATNNLIVATVQYRLGSLGFAYLGTTEVAGNMGLWDQVEALKWICENVEFFGGTCANHTIAGESAGAASVTYHLLATASRSYFNRAIVQSGSTLSPWAFRSPQLLRTITELSFESVGEGACRSPRERLMCLQQQPGYLFPFADLVPQIAGFSMPFVPTIDGDFLTTDPFELLATGQFYKIPLLAGFTRDEGSLYLLTNPEIASLLPMPPKIDNSILKRFNYSDLFSLMNLTMAFMQDGRSFNPALSRVISAQYWPRSKTPDGWPSGEEVVESVVQAVGDYSLTCPTLQWANWTAGQDNSSVFSYRFSQRRSNHFWPEWTGVMHADELPFMFGEPFAEHAQNYGYSKEDRVLSRVMMAYWTNFAKYGDPNERDCSSPNLADGKLKLKTWPRFEQNSPGCPQQALEINSTVLLFRDKSPLVCGIKSRDCLFWTTVFPDIDRALKGNNR